MFAQVVLFDGFDPLDAIGPYETLLAGGMRAELVTAEGPREVESGIGISLRATARLDPERDGLVLVPGAAAREEDEILVLLAKAATTLAEPMRRALDRRGLTVATVCGGSLALAMAGLLGGRTATTNHLGLEVLASYGVTAVPARIVVDGDLVTASGVTSGVDLGLWLVERESGSRKAFEVEQVFAHERRGTVWSAA
ncbi:DJ-1/PfpI family protein [Lentzea xinjiangensis]|uniref:DJ-1/PfpI family protein n=1 Tax=Lentzea xinjiangensis TaxID=402600 RepID=A0A1H9PP34_9PSEU|nr:DJ-1/PfpI family protein [Lentzea xinjiangensis]SER49565.1 DJ-1/PfpI family protein [Lentzea xinjiangensis]